MSNSTVYPIIGPPASPPPSSSESSGSSSYFTDDEELSEEEFEEAEANNENPEAKANNEKNERHVRMHSPEQETTNQDLLRDVVVVENVTREKEEEDQTLETLVEKDETLEKQPEPDIVIDPRELEFPEIGLIELWNLGPRLIPIAIAMRKERIFPLCDLSHLSISPIQCQTLVRCALGMNRSIEVVDFNHMIMCPQDPSAPVQPDHAVSTLLGSIQKNPWSSICSLQLSNNHLTDAIVPALVAFFNSTTSLQHLDLSHNRLTARGMAEWWSTGTGPEMSPSLTSLELAHNPLGDALAFVMSEVQWFRHNISMTYLNVSECRLSNQGAVAIVHQLTLEPTSVLQTLVLYGHELVFPQDQVALVDSNSRSPHVYPEINIDTLCAPSLGELLPRCVSLERINLSGTTLNVRDILTRRSCDLSHAHLSEVDGFLLSHLLPQNPRLEILNVGHNPQLGQFATLEIFQRLLQCPTLRKLNMVNTVFVQPTGKGRKVLALSIYALVGETMGDLIISHPNLTLEYLQVDVFEFHLPTWMGTCETFVTELDLREALDLSLIEQHLSAKCLSQNTRLSSLNGLECDELDHVWELSNVDFEFYELAFISLKVAKHPRLTKVSCTHSNWCAKGLAFLTNELRNHHVLEDLDFEHNVAIGSEGGQVMGECLEFNTGLRKLNLSWSGLEDAGLENIGLALRVNQTLEELDIRGNNIHRRGIQHLCDGLVVNTRLKKLNLRWNPIDANCAELLGQMLDKNRSLTELDLEQHDIGPAGVSHLVETLGKKNKILTTLNIRGDAAFYPLSCGLGLVGGQALSQVLAHRYCVLQHIYLGDNQLGEDGMAVMVEALAGNTSLRTLDLSRNQLSDLPVVRSFFQLVGQHPNLTSVDLEGNAIGLEAIPSCIQALKQSLSLQSLSLVSNDLTEEGFILFADHMSSFALQFIRLIFGTKTRVSSRTKRRFQLMPKPLVIDIE